MHHFEGLLNTGHRVTSAGRVPTTATSVDRRPHAPLEERLCGVLMLARQSAEWRKKSFMEPHKVFCFA